MRSPKTRAAYLLAGVAALGVALPACGDDDEGGSGGGGESAVPECLSFADLYALIGPEAEGVNNWSGAAELAAELGSETVFPDADLTLVGPGTESGTYDSFIEIAFADIAEARVEAGAIGEDQAEQARPDYSSQADDNAIIAQIEGAENSLGWVGFAFAEEAGDAVKELQVAAEPGGECVAPTAETIADGSYPLSRGLYIYVNKANLESNPALAAYVDFYLGEGYSAVEEVGYVGLPEDQLATSVSAFEEAGVEPTAGASGEITISGSSTVEPISVRVAELFADVEPGVEVTVDGPGTGDGFVLFCEGSTDISDASRPIKEEEAAACEEAGIEFIELKVAFDGMAVMTKG